MKIMVELVGQLTTLLTEHGVTVSDRIGNGFIKILSGYTISRKENIKLPNIEKRVEHFLTVKRIDGLSASTLKSYALILRMFAKQANKNVAQITTDDIREYMVYLTTERRLKDSSLCTQINTLRSFFSWMLAEGLIRRNPMSQSKTKKIDKYGARHGLSSEEMERLRDACRTYREKALIELYYSTGCRLSEIVNARLDDLNMHERSMQVIGKGGKVRVVYFSNRAKYMLSAYLKGPHNGLDLFCSCKKPYAPLGDRAVQKIVREIGERGGISHRVHPHLLRHTFASFSINAGMEITVIQTLLGHSDVGTTQIYAEISQASVRREYERIIAIA